MCGSGPARDSLKTKADKMRTVKENTCLPSLSTLCVPPRPQKKPNKKTPPKTPTKPQNYTPPKKITTKKTQHPTPQRKEKPSGSERWKKRLYHIVLHTVVNSLPLRPVCVWKIKYNIFLRNGFLRQLFPYPAGYQEIQVRLSVAFSSFSSS